MAGSVAGTVVFSSSVVQVSRRSGKMFKLGIYLVFQCCSIHLARVTERRRLRVYSLHHPGEGRLVHSSQRRSSSAELRHKGSCPSRSEGCSARELHCSCALRAILVERFPHALPIPEHLCLSACDVRAWVTSIVSIILLVSSLLSRFCWLDRSAAPPYPSLCKSMLDW